MFVERVSRLMQRCKEPTRNVAPIDPGGNPDIAHGKLCAERMMRPVKATALEVVADLAATRSPKSNWACSSNDPRRQLSSIFG